jgi:hypothetical protein
VTERQPGSQRRFAIASRFTFDRKANTIFENSAINSAHKPPLRREQNHIRPYKATFRHRQEFQKRNNSLGAG